MFMAASNVEDFFNCSRWAGVGSPIDISNYLNPSERLYIGFRGYADAGGTVPGITGSGDIPNPTYVGTYSVGGFHYPDDEVANDEYFVAIAYIPADTFSAGQQISGSITLDISGGGVPIE
jgi:hypothetical protein